MSINIYAKAIAAFVSAGAVSVQTALTAGSPGGAHVTQGEWIAAVVQAVIVTAAVYGVPNASVTPDGTADDSQDGLPEPEHGEVAEPHAFPPDSGE